MTKRFIELDATLIYQFQVCGPCELKAMYDADGQSFPAGKVHASPAGRQPFQPARMCLAGHLEGGYPRISTRIPAKAGGYPPGDADAGADAAFPGKSNRISGCNTTISSF
ncbi:hypothetical protein PGT21_013061 [Puccinia graminis f. sp. tritici]|uniref:Uncharacterized protein n=1 Tax=Puccinia graminis f. sp. tritici TaxID=56615 RepID=A0A5B0RAJ0_PUCGR|nr:hypothetical protein PGT21_013061 [Puccinia graminis f. sp. tritici]KAA1122075.1 hypothetical protein PGTUg99_025913 [Puccinia graminis f. sp. tritici]